MMNFGNCRQGEHSTIVCFLLYIYSTVRILRRYLVSSATSDQSVHIFIYYIVESEILKNTRSDIFSISSLVRISIT